MFKLPLSESLLSGHTPWQEGLSQLARRTITSSSPEPRSERGGWDLGRREKKNLCHPLLNRPSRLSFDRGGGNIMQVIIVCFEVYPQYAGLFGVYSGDGVCAVSLFLICAFLSTCEFSTCRAPSVPDLFIPDGQQGPRAQGPPEQPRLSYTG